MSPEKLRKLADERHARGDKEGATYLHKLAREAEVKEKVQGGGGEVTPPETPLNVQVAHAIGCTPRLSGLEDNIPSGLWMCPCGGIHAGMRLPLAPYGSDSPEGWAATGPLLARYGIECVGVYTGRANLPAQWRALEGGQGHAGASGEPRWAEESAPSPCEAIARLIVRLAGEGRLPK